MKKQESLQTLNLTIVALVALVAIVGLTAIVLNGGAQEASPLSIGEENAAGQASHAILYSKSKIGSGGGNCCTGDGGGVNTCSSYDTQDRCDLMLGCSWDCVGSSSS